MKFTILCISFLFISIFQNVSAQITVGSDIAPRKGSLLDIKDKNTTGRTPNADGGLGLPRVDLISPTTLTVDNPSQNGNYVGVTVYNTGANFLAGIYTWDGRTWKLSVSVNDYGANGQLLQSNGNGKFGWSTFVFPEFSYHKPTQISAFDSNNATKRIYSYNALTMGGTGGQYGGYAPAKSTFDGDKALVYSDELNIQSAESNDKYLLMGISASIRPETYDNYTPNKSYWQLIRIDIYLADNNGLNERILQRNDRLYPTAAKGDIKVYVDLFSIVPVTGFGKGAYKLKIKISNIEHTLSNNSGTGQGYFPPKTAQLQQNFYLVTLNDVNFILYEND